jgi:4-hydroxybenzoate polyprenyltransferase
LELAEKTEGQTFGGASLAARYASFVKLPHTLFALPFAMVGVILATYGGATPSLVQIVWVLLAFTAARFAAMGFNRIVDREFDARNPRTSQRELPSGKLTVPQATVAVVAASALFLVAAWQLNPLCGKLAPIALAWVFFYSYTKRFTALSHVVLGFALGIAPVGAYLAVTGAWPTPWYSLVVLAASVMCWVAGFDVLYAIQDIDFDRTHGLHSIPARLGMRNSLWASRLLHLAAVAGFFSVWARHWFGVGVLYVAGVAVMAALLAYEHGVVGWKVPATLDLPRVDRAFFRVNVAVSMSFLFFTLLDRIFA